MTVSTLTLLVLRIGFLLLLWVFVFAIVYALRSDLFGQRVRKLQSDAAATPFPQAGSASGGAASAAAATEAVGVAGGRSSGVSDSPLAGLARPVTGPVENVGARTGAARPAGARSMATSLTASKLVITSGPRRGTEVALGTDPLTIGRSGESGLVIRDDYTSTHHARLMLWNNEWMIQDLDSTNGTFLDGQRVTVPTQVPLDAPIKIGTTTFELRR